MSFKPSKGKPTRKRKPEPGPETVTVEGEILPPEPETTSPENPSSTASSTSSTDHLDGIEDEIGEPDASADTDAPGGADVGTDAGGGAGPQPPPGAAAFEEWYREVFVAVHQEASAMSGLQSIAAHAQRPISKPAARALYRTCCRHRWLHWLLRLDDHGPWADAAMIAAYLVPLVLMIRAEIAMKAGASTDEAGAARGGADDPMSRAAGQTET